MYRFFNRLKTLFSITDGFIQELDNRLEEVIDLVPTTHSLHHSREDVVLKGFTDNIENYL